jgi:hypothetical protein
MKRHYYIVSLLLITFFTKSMDHCTLQITHRAVYNTTTQPTLQTIISNLNNQNNHSAYRLSPVKTILYLGVYTLSILNIALASSLMYHSYDSQKIDPILRQKVLEDSISHFSLGIPAALFSGYRLYKSLRS